MEVHDIVQEAVIKTIPKKKKCKKPKQVCTVAKNHKRTHKRRLYTWASTDGQY